MLTANSFTEPIPTFKGTSSYLGAEGVSADDVMMEQVVKGSVNIAAAVQGTLLWLTGTLLLILMHRIISAKNWTNQSAVPGELKPIRFTWNNLPTGHDSCWL